MQSHKGPASLAKYIDSNYWKGKFNIIKNTLGHDPARIILYEEFNQISNKERKKFVNKKGYNEFVKRLFAVENNLPMNHFERITSFIDMINLIPILDKLIPENKSLVELAKQVIIRLIIPFKLIFLVEEFIYNTTQLKNIRGYLDEESNNLLNFLNNNFETIKFNPWVYFFNYRNHQSSIIKDFKHFCNYISDNFNIPIL